MASAPTCKISYFEICGDAGKRHLHAINKLNNFMLARKVNLDVCPHLYGASLIATEKKDGGVRPIAIGNTFRRLAAKLDCTSVKEEIGDYLRPRQLGFGTLNACESIIHSARTFLDLNKNNGKILLKIDFKNAFNCIERDSMLK
mgnify:CR=1 FL=1